MTKSLTTAQRLDLYGREHPLLLWLLNAALALFVTLVLLTTTEAPLVLYQAF